MANLIRLKQIEGSSQLEAAISAGNAISESGGSFEVAVSNAVSQSLVSSLSASIITIITNNVAATLPDGVVSGSSQIFITGTIGYSDIATDIEVAVISSSISSSQILISSSISSSIANVLSGSLSSITILSSSVNNRLNSLELFSSSLDNTYATDAELSVSQSNIDIDMGEW
jgi:hypothetical protein